ncbi:MAG: hypothetical protein JO112_21175 [Planctomycetes bacterium]|nr:hypothetical protein [Planctomycetota bacterium]
MSSKPTTRASIVLLVLALAPGRSVPGPEDPPRYAEARERVRLVREREYYDRLPPGARARLGSLHFVQPGAIRDLALLPDGKTLVSTAGEEPGNLDQALTLRFWEEATGTLRAAEDLIGGVYNQAQFSPDYRRAYLLSFPALGPPEGGKINRRQGIDVMDVATGKRLRCVASYRGFIEAFAVSPDEKLLAVCADLDYQPTKALALWDLTTGKELHSFSEVLPLLQKEVSFYRLDQLAISPDSRTLGTFAGKTVFLWDAQTGKGVRRLEAPAETLTVQDAHGRRELRSNINRIMFSHDGRLLAYTESLYRALHLCDVATGKELRRLAGGYVSVAFSPDDRYLAAVEYQGAYTEWAVPKWGAIHVWETATGREVASFGKERAPTVVTFGPGAKTLFSGGRDGKLRRWELPAGKLVPPPTGHGSGVRSLVFSPDGKTLASLGDSICLWDMPSGRALRRFAQDSYRDPLEPDPAVTSPRPLYPDEPRIGLKDMAFSGDGRRLVTWGWDLTFRHWDTATGKELHVVKNGSAYGPEVTEVLSPDGRNLAYYGGAMKLHFLDPETGKERCQAQLTGTEVGACIGLMVFSLDGKVLAALGSTGESGQLWEALTAKHCGTLNRERASSMGLVTGLAFSPDGRTIAARVQKISMSSSIVLWDVVTGQKTQELPADGGPLCRFSPDGQLLAFVEPRKEEIVLWDLSAKRERRRFAGHLRPVFYLAFSPDGKTLASGSSDGTVLLWDLTAPGTGNETKPSDGDKTGPAQTEARPGVPLAPSEVEELWRDLAGDDAQRAFQAMWKLSAAPAQSVPFLEKHSRAVTAPAPERLTRLIADLDSNWFSVREQAEHELETLGPLAVPALEQARRGRLSEEARRRAEGLLDRLSQSRLPPETLRALRAVQVLEHSGTAKAREVLASLARGAPEADLTREARASLERLARPVGREP